MFKLDRKETRIVLIFGIILFIWFNFLIKEFYKIANGNSMLYYFLFILIYSGFIAYFIFGVHPSKNPRLIFAYFLTFLLGDLLIFPLLIPMDKPPILTQETIYSSDVFVYNFIKGLNVPDVVKYNLVYVGASLAILLIIGFLLEGKRFTDALRSVF